MSKSLIIVTKGLAPYRLDFYEAIADRLAQKVSLAVPSTKTLDHPWVESQKNREIAIKEFILREKGSWWVAIARKMGFAGAGTYGFSWALWKYLSDEKPRALLIHEASPFCLTALTWGRLHHVPVFQSSEIGRGAPDYAGGLCVRGLHALVSFFIAGRIANTRIAMDGYGISRPCVFAPHAVSVQKFAKIKTRNLSAQGVTLLFVGRILPHKGISLLLKSLRDLIDQEPDLEIALRIVGTGEIECFSKEASQLGLDSQVTFVGFKEGDNLRREYQEADVFVLPTHYDTYAVVVHEAAAAGLPIVVSDAAGAAEVLVQNTGAGIVVPSQNQEQLTKALREMVIDPALRARCGASARTVALKYDVHVSAKKVAAEFNLL